MGVLEPLRRVFARTAAARERGLKPTAFSFNSAAGACRVCEGAGYEKVELQFLPDAFVKCGACDGRRFRPEVLEVRCHGLSIADALDLPAADVVRLFGEHAGVRARAPADARPRPRLPVAVAARAHAVGRRGAAAEARAGARRGRERAADGSTCSTSPRPGCTPRTSRCWSAPCTAWSTRATRSWSSSTTWSWRAAADWIVDLGPEAGADGGRVVGEGTPEHVARLDTPTGRALAAVIHRGARSHRSRGSGGTSVPAEKERKRGRGPAIPPLRSLQAGAPARSA